MDKIINQLNNFCASFLHVYMCEILSLLGCSIRNFQFNNVKVLSACFQLILSATSFDFSFNPSYNSEEKLNPELDFVSKF